MFIKVIVMESTEVVQEAVQEEEYHWIIRQIRIRSGKRKNSIRIRSADNQVRTRIVMEAVREEEYDWKLD